MISIWIPWRSIRHTIQFSAEHLLCIAAAVHYIFTRINRKFSVIDFVRTLLASLVPQSDILPMWIAILISFINENATFIWNYIDIFIMIVSIGLSTHFKLLNIELEQATIEVKNTFVAFTFIWAIPDYFMRLFSFFIFFRTYLKIIGRKCGFSMQNCVTSLLSLTKESRTWSSCLFWTIYS